jgi:hypothetical protein
MLRSLASAIRKQATPAATEIQNTKPVYQKIESIICASSLQVSQDEQEALATMWLETPFVQGNTRNSLPIYF